jgi:hypothetical protein
MTDTMAAAHEAPSAPEPPGPAYHQATVTPIRQGRSGHNEPLRETTGSQAPRLPDQGRPTAGSPGSRPPVPVPCTSCGDPHPPSKTGLCRPCFYASPWQRRNALSKRGQGESRKTDPERMTRQFLLPMLRSAARRAMAEDPGTGLAGLLQVQQEVNQLVREVGRHQVTAYGPVHVGAELGWSYQRVQERWKPYPPPQCPAPALPRKEMPL